MSGASMKVSEAAFQSQLRQLATMLGWKQYHGWLSVRSPTGFPDMLLLRRRPDGSARCVVAELKSETGKLTAPQAEWLELLGAVPGIEAFVWRPDDLEDIARILGADEYVRSTENPENPISIRRP